MTVPSPAGRPRCSVVILNWNRADLALACCRSVEAQTFADLEIVILDNASSDDSVERLTRECPRARVVRNPANEGTGGGFAAGARAARGEFILFLCNDTVLDPDVVAKLVEVMERNPDCGICGAKHVLYKSPGTIELLGYAIDKFGMQHCYRCGEPDDGADAVREAWVSGTVLMARREAYDKAGGYDPVHFTLNDEVDLCWRVRLQGYRLLVRSGARVVHHHFATLSAESRARTRYWAERHLIRTLLKNYGALSLLRILPQYALLLAAEMVYLGAQGLWGMAWADVRAVGWNLRMLPDTCRQRRRIQRARTIADRELRHGFWPGCIRIQWALELLRRGRRLGG